MRSDTRVVRPRSGKSVEAEVASDTRWSGEKAARRLGPALLIVDRKHQSQSDPSIPSFRFLRTGPFAFPSSQRSRDSCPIRVMGGYGMCDVGPKRRLVSEGWFSLHSNVLQGRRRGEIYAHCQEAMDLPGQWRWMTGTFASLSFLA